MAFSDYNPFNPIGRYYIKLYLYKNKQNIIGITVLFIVLLVALGLFLWSEGTKEPYKPYVHLPPPPKYGYGPYGYGEYGPPRAIFENSPDLM